MVKKRSKYSYPEKKGLYDFANEHDACGVGLVANIDGDKTHKIIEQGIEVLERLVHRGAVGGDPDTGDGAGILFQLPDKFFKESAGLDFKLPGSGEYGVAMLFMPQDRQDYALCENIITNSITEEGLSILGWRDVPTDDSSLGKLAKESQPKIVQIFIGKGTSQLDESGLERKLYVTRRVIDNAVEAKLDIGDSFYIVSISCRTVIYKGLLMAPQVLKFFPDLNNENMVSALAIVHQRYSTNTFPTWPLAQPFRYLAHNGEINTLRGNMNQMRARQDSLQSDLFGDDVKKLFPVVPEGQSDSACIDNALELFVNGGRSLPHSMMMLVPQAWGEKYHLGMDLKGFYEYHAGLMEPWDGPAALAFTDGISIGAMLDRNGLRPARYTITKDNFIVLGSEAGILDIPAENVKSKGRLRPGDMIYVDLEKKRILFDTEIKQFVARQQPYRRWVEENKISLHGFSDSVVVPEVDKKTLLKKQRLFGYTREDLDMVMKVMCETGQEGTGSMGNDAALAILSEKPQLLYSYFKQLFAQVTNPPIDPIREDLVMSLTTFIGNKGNILKEVPQQAHLLKLKSPILTNEGIDKIRSSKLDSFKVATIQLGFNATEVEGNLESAIEAVNVAAEKAVRSGSSVIVLSDKNLADGLAPIPTLLAVASVNHHLIRCGLRTSAGVIAETGEAREIMHFALLLGYGATAIVPYLAMESIAHQVQLGKLKEKLCAAKAIENYIKAIGKGLLKVMSKMGISTLRSYRGAQVFEAVGLDEDFVNQYFTGTASRIGGITFKEIARETLMRYENSVSPKPGSLNMLENGGNYYYRENGEKHLWTPEVITTFQKAVRTNDRSLYNEYASYVNNQAEHLCTLRGLFKFKETTSIPLSEVEPASEIAKRFVSGAMSYGSISKEAHESIAIAMNRLGGMSNSGEGGEDPKRFIPLKNNDSKCSAIKQVASGRFGVTAEYLANSKEIQIKISQGAKPGEGGQLPGHKVNDVIAKVRHSTPGVTLISPPPHHDIYSIEDLAQLIYDLKNANPDARVSVKLVSEVGVGTVAAGVSKGHSDMVLISGHDGGTGASPMTSIKHAGLPWELGLAETQQTLVLNKLRDRIRVQVDGQMKTGRDVIIGALLGAEEYGFATTILVALGCLIMRKCHSNTCPVGIATQDPELRKCFKGKPEHIENFLLMIAEEVREYLAQFGFKSLDEAIGRSDLLETDNAIDFWKTKNLDFSNIFARSDDKSLPVRCLTKQDHGLEKALDNRLIEVAKEAIENKTPVKSDFKIENTDRTVGTMLSSKVAKKYGNIGLPAGTIDYTFTGYAGQSFGAFLTAGTTFTLLGEANDYVGKGLSGGKIIIKPEESATFTHSKNIIVGNVLLYGATDGEIYINGMGGERFAIRNSGARAVIEGVGDHCCEYMTGGCIVVIGETGRNFGAGMSGGIAYVYDENNMFDQLCNLSMVDLEAVVIPEDVSELKELIENQYKHTGSKKAKAILDNWESALPMFVKVFPMEYRRVLGQMMKEDAEIKRVVVTA